MAGSGSDFGSDLLRCIGDVLVRRDLYLRLRYPELVGLRRLRRLRRLFHIYTPYAHESHVNLGTLHVIQRLEISK